MTRGRKNKKRLQSIIDPDRVTCCLAIMPESMSVTFPSEATEHHGATGGDSEKVGGKGPCAAETKQTFTVQKSTPCWRCAVSV